MAIIESLYGDVDDPSGLYDGNVHNIVLRRPEQDSWRDNTLHIDPITRRSCTFGQFLDKVSDLATGLALPVDQGGLGLDFHTKDHIVGILSSNSSDYIALIQALTVITVPYALLSSYATPFELEHALKLAKASHLFVDPKLFKRGSATAQNVGLPSQNIFVIGGKVTGRRNLDDFVALVRRKKIPRIAVKEATRKTLAYLVFSSGTTGLPKAVMISHGNIRHSLLQSAKVGEHVAKVYPPDPSTATTPTVSLDFLPIYHTYGLHMTCFYGFLMPHTLVILPKWDVNLALKAIPQYRINSIRLIPSVIHQLVHHPGIDKVDFSSLTGMGSGAAYLPPDLADRLKKIVPATAELAEGYGMSETTIGAISQPQPGILGGRVQPTRGSTGILIPGMQARIIRADGSDADINEPGELLLKGNNIALGYFNNPKATSETFVEGWLHTGDHFRINESGAFFFADRVKDTLKISGMQVSPLEIEEVLLSHPDALIIDACVAGVSGGRTTDEKIPCAWVVLSAAGKRKPKKAVLDALDKWSKERLSKYKWLRGGIHVVDAIPKNPTGKVLKRVLQDQYERNVRGRSRVKL